MRGLLDDLAEAMRQAGRDQEGTLPAEELPVAGNA